MAMENVRISAFHLGKISAVQAAGGPGDPFGFAGIQCRRFTYKDAGGTVKLNDLDLAGNNVAIGGTRLVFNLLT